MRSREVKKKRGARARRASGYRVLAGPRGRRAATGASVRLPVLCGAARPSRSNRGPLGNTAGLVRALAPPLRACGVDPQSFRSLPRARTRCGSAWFCAAPPISGEQPLGAMPPNSESSAIDRRAGLWSARTHRQGRMNITRQSYVSCFRLIGPLPTFFWLLETSKKTDEPHDARVDASSHA